MKPQAGILVALVVLLALGACRSTPIDVGSRLVENEPPAAEPAPTQAPADASPPTLEERLRARCDGPPGQADEYASARDLTDRITRRWYLCDDPNVTPLGTSSGVELRRDGTWSILALDREGDRLTTTSDPDEGGTFEYLVYSDPNAGAGADGGGAGPDGGPGFVPLEDPSSRGGLFIYFRRPVSTVDIVVVASFEADPRRMRLRDAGRSPRAARYVSTAGLE